jgi:hypothetical protein
MYPPITPPYGFKLKRHHFTYHEMNGMPWAECAKHDDVYHECLDSGGFAIGDDCIGCVIEERIIELLEAQCTCRTVMRNGYMVKGICPAHTHIALIKGEK